MIRALLACLLLFSGPYRANAQEPHQSPSPEQIVILTQNPLIYAEGPANAQLIVVYYTDLLCETCSAQQKVIDALRAEYPNIRIVYKDVPFKGGPSLDLALGQIAAIRQGQGQAYRKQLQMLPLEQRDPELIARMVPGMNIDRFMRDFGETESLRLTKTNYDEAAKMGINAVPAFIIRQRLIKGPQSLEQLRGYVRSALLLN